MTDWQKMLIQKREEVARWCSEHNVTISYQLVELWDQAMKLGEENGKKAYQEFLNGWQEFQKNPPKDSQGQNGGEPTAWQKMLLQKQVEVVLEAQKNGVTIPQAMIGLWEKAINLGEAEGQKYYQEFLSDWEELKKTFKQQGELNAGQYTNGQYGIINNHIIGNNAYPNGQNYQYPNNQYGNPNYNQPNYNYGNPYNYPGNYPNYNQPNYNQPNYNQPNYNQPNNNQPNFNQPNMPNNNQPNNNQPNINPENNKPNNNPENNQPGNFNNPGNYQPGNFNNPGNYQPEHYQPNFNNPGYQPNYNTPGNFQPNYNNPGYNMPYFNNPGNNQPNYNFNNPGTDTQKNEPLAGQQVNEWQQSLLNVQQEIVQWAQQNGIQVGQDVMKLWDEAMQKGDKATYDKFMQTWNEIKSDPKKYAEATGQNMEPWKAAIFNQLEGQKILASMLGVNATDEPTNIRENIEKGDPNTINSILTYVMEKWNQINNEIGKRSQTANQK